MTTTPLTATDAFLPKDTARTAPAPRRKTPPVFIGDILTHHNGVPTLLLQWWAAQDEKEKDGHF